MNQEKIESKNTECFMIIANPGENANHEINISWHTKINRINSILLYMEYQEDNINWDNALRVKGSYYLNEEFDGNYSITKDRVDTYERSIFLHYHVELKNLKENTKYMYKVGETEYSDIHYFKTGASEYSFAWVSDFHAYTPLPSRMALAFQTTEKVIDKIKGVDFIFCGGDAIAWGGSYSFWKEMYEQPLVKNYMWVNIVGNHDFMSRANIKNTAAYFRDVNYFPRNGYQNQMGVCYHFTYGDSLFIILNNEAMGFEEDNQEIRNARAWLISILKENKSKFIFVCQHYEWFQGLTGASRIWGNLRFKDIFDEYKVDIALGNNNHVYVRTKSVYKDKPSNDVNFGTTYIQSPSSDNERGQELKEMIYNQDIIEKRFSEGGKTIGVLACKVTNDNVTFTLYDRDTNEIDQTVINKRR